MDTLATITLNLREPASRDVVLKIKDISYAIADNPSAGADVFMYTGKVWQVTETAAQVRTAIDTLWDEYIAALGDPA